MKTKDFVQHMKQRIDDYCQKNSVSVTRFGLLAVGDPSAYSRIENMTMRRFQKIEKYLDKKV